MKTRAATVREAGRRIEIEELDLDGPREGEALVRFTHAGLCHSDIHVVAGTLPTRLPMVLGHEGSGVVEEVGPGVSRVKSGDRVVCSFIPVCGICRWCATGRQSICDQGAGNRDGALPGPRFPFTKNGGVYGAMCTLGTFSQYSTVHQNSLITIEDDIPLDKAALVGCGVPTGWGSAVYTARVEPGETVVVVGAGGIGMNALQGARYAGAKNVLAVDPVAFKRETAPCFGATHAVASTDDAHAVAMDLTAGAGADKVILTADLVTEDQISAAFAMTAKGGTVVITGINDMEARNIQLPASLLTLFRKSVAGSLFGDCNPTADIPMLLGLYKSGDLELDGLITCTYELDQINEGYADLSSGRIIRGLIVHDAK